ncbi:hypothetical protein AWE51_14945 [Aquimarina aggregata]|uniref:Uncharacterized protein n=1 Tax=Aquimarina aggregata TaxID=1642818 RepID=A0A162Y153_9FLAO|nr:hypothetical protein [Aquimarina aggregata]KZS38875.1 hypothetical protein AWE51_14945 [Aquimarina aggregata]
MNANFTDTKFILQIIKIPEMVIDKLNLVYTNDKNLITSALKHTEGFQYFLNDFTNSEYSILKLLESYASTFLKTIKQ